MYKMMYSRASSCNSNLGEVCCPPHCANVYSVGWMDFSGLGGMTCDKSNLILREVSGVLIGESV